MKPQKSIIKELKTYEHNLFKSNKEHKKININDFPNLSRKPIEWMDCDQFIKLRQFKCDKRLAINLCQQYKIHRSDQKFFDTIQNVNVENEEYKKIQNCTSFLLRQIRQNQQKKQKLRMDYQESQFDSKMSSILDHSFSQFQRSLDKHIEIKNDIQHTFNLKQLTKEQLLRKLQSLNKGLKENIQTENIQSNESFQKISLPTTFISIHPTLTDKKYSKAQTPTSQLQTQRDTKSNFTRTFVKWQLNSKSNRSLQQIKKIRDDQGKFKPSLSKDLLSTKIKHEFRILNKNEQFLFTFKIQHLKIQFDISISFMILIKLLNHFFLNLAIQHSSLYLSPLYSFNLSQLSNTQFKKYWDFD